MSAENESGPDTDQRVLRAKRRASILAMSSIGVLIALTAGASVVTGSVGLLADAIHSVIDLAGAVIGFVGIRVSEKPPDADHAFGHAKAESLAGAAISTLIFVAAGVIVYRAVERLAARSPVEQVPIGLVVTVVVVVINVAIAWHVLRVSRATDSPALEATARDLLADTYSSIAVLVGLLLVGITGMSVFDPIVALGVAFLIARTAYYSMKKCVAGLMDTSLPVAEEESIRQAILEHCGDIAGFHALRTRKSGKWRYVDVHLVVPRDRSVNVAHQLCDHLEEDITKRLGGASVIIHVEPCLPSCPECSAACAARQDTGSNSPP